LVTLVRDVAVETQIDELGTPEIDGAKLIGFLKAMEFTTITRRVGEICGVDPSRVEADPTYAGGGGWRGRNGEARDPPAAPSAPQAAEPAPAGAATPEALARTRAEAAKSEKSMSPAMRW